MQQLAEQVLMAGLLGFLGGLTRSMVGILKAMAQKQKLRFNYWLVTVICSAVIGAFCGIIFDYDYKLALLGGYAGTDILEGIYKAFSKEKFLVIKK